MLITSGYNRRIGNWAQECNPERVEYRLKDLEVQSTSGLSAVASLSQPPISLRVTKIEPFGFSPEMLLETQLFEPTGIKPDEYEQK